jgi:hypothetical protein
VFGVPVNGTTYTIGDAIAGGGTVLYSGGLTSLDHTGLNPETIYYYKAFSFDAANEYSFGMEANATTAPLPTLAVTPPDLIVPAPEGITSFNVTSNTAWTVFSDQTWCTVDPTGSGNGPIPVNYSENILAAQRVAHITVTANGLDPIVVSLTQLGASPTLTVTPPDQPVSDPVGTTSFTVTSNADWAVTSDQTWCTATASGTGNGEIAVNYQKNTALTGRVATLTVTVAGLTPVSVTVTQSAAAPMLAVTPPDQAVSQDAGTVSYTVTSNVDWVASSDSAWCSITQSGTGDGTIVANYPENPFHVARIATISVTGVGLPTQTVTLSQSLSTFSVPELPANGMRIYPNPARGMFIIAVDKARYPSMEVTLTDLAGAKVLNRKCSGEKEYRFDIGSVPQGCYFVRIDTGREVVVRKLVIIR